MTCRSCSARIDDRAIVCYRCGAPTVIPATRRPAAHEPRPQMWPWVALMVIIAVLVTVYFLMSPAAPPVEAPLILPQP
jgi:predicted amidophosphoribosyltransferase